MNFNEYLAKHKIVKAEDLPKDEKIYFKKDFFGWRLVNPVKNEDMTINWEAAIAGRWINLIKIFAVIVIILFAVYAYSHDINAVKEQAKGCLDDPVKYCQAVLNPYQSNPTSVPGIKMPLSLGDEHEN